MNAPKILPWLAHKAGVSDTRAEALWAEAIEFATERTNWAGTPDYWKAAVNRLAELLELESQSFRTITSERDSAHRRCAVTEMQNQKRAA